MVKVHRVCCDTDGVVETGTVEYVLFRQDIFTYDPPALPYSHERGDTVHIGILESRDESLEIPYDFGILPDAYLFALGILLRIGSIHSVDPGHVDPPFIRRHPGHEYGPFHGQVVALFASLPDLVAEPHHRAVVVGAEEFVRDEVDVIHVRMVRHGVPQFPGIDSAH